MKILSQQRPRGFVIVHASMAVCALVLLCCHGTAVVVAVPFCSAMSCVWLHLGPAFVWTRLSALSRGPAPLVLFVVFSLIVAYNALTPWPPLTTEGKLIASLPITLFGQSSSQWGSSMGALLAGVAAKAGGEKKCSFTHEQIQSHTNTHTTPSWYQWQQQTLCEGAHHKKHTILFTAARFGADSNFFTTTTERLLAVAVTTATVLLQRARQWEGCPGTRQREGGVPDEGRPTLWRSREGEGHCEAKHQKIGHLEPGIQLERIFLNVVS